MIHLDTNYLIGLLVKGSPQVLHVDGWLAAGQSLAAGAVAWTEFLNGPVSPLEVKPVVERLLVMLGELDPARLHLDESAARPDEVGEFSVLAREADAVLEGGSLGQVVGVVAEGSKQVEEKCLGFALLVALQFGGELGELPHTIFE
jgi:hypothetical protein